MGTMQVADIDLGVKSTTDLICEKVSIEDAVGPPSFPLFN